MCSAASPMVASSLFVGGTSSPSRTSRYARAARPSSSAAARVRLVDTTAHGTGGSDRADALPSARHNGTGDRWRTGTAWTLGNGDARGRGGVDSVIATEALALAVSAGVPVLLW